MPVWPPLVMQAFEENFDDVIVVVELDPKYSAPPMNPLFCVNVQFVHVTLPPEAYMADPLVVTLFCTNAVDDT